MANSFSLDGVSMKIMGIDLIEKPVVSAPEMTEIVQDIPGKRGKLYMGTNVGSRTITLKVALLCESAEELNDRKMFLDNFIVNENPYEAELILDEDPLWSYYGHFTSRSDYEDNAINEAITTLTFVCSDPVKYGEQIDTTIVDDRYAFTPMGQQKTYPVFKAIAQQDNTWCGMTTNDQFVFVGGKVDVETGETATEVYKKVLNDTAQDLNLWQRQTYTTFTQINNGTVGKEAYFKQEANTFNVKDFGENTGSDGKWYGPASKRMLTSQLQNWKVRFRVQTKVNYKRAKNKIELYLLDSSSTVIGRMTLKDNGVGSEQELIVAIIKGTGSTQTICSLKPTVKNSKTVALSKKQKVKKTDKKGKVTYEWVTLKETLTENKSTNELTDFYGYIELEKAGNKFIANVVSLDLKTGNQKKKWSYTWTDTSGVFNKQLAGFIVYAGKIDITEDKKNIEYKANHLAFCDLQVWERNVITEETIISTTAEKIVFAGDEIVFDCERGRIYKNGIEFMESMHIGSDFIEFVGGVAEEIIFADGYEWTMHYRPTSY